MPYKDFQDFIDGEEMIYQQLGQLIREIWSDKKFPVNESDEDQITYLLSDKFKSHIPFDTRKKLVSHFTTAML